MENNFITMHEQMQMAGLQWQEERQGVSGCWNLKHASIAWSSRTGAAAEDQPITAKTQ